MIDISETENIELLYAMEDMDFDEVREVKGGGIYDYWNWGGIQEKLGREST